MFAVYRFRKAELADIPALLDLHRAALCYLASAHYSPGVTGGARSGHGAAQNSATSGMGGRLPRAAASQQRLSGS